MREVFSKTVEDKRVVVSEGTFDHTGVDAGWADLIVVAQVSRQLLDVALSRFDASTVGVSLVPGLRRSHG